MTPPPDLSPRQTVEWLREARRRIGDGEVIDSDAAYGELKPRNLSDLKALMPKPGDDAEPERRPELDDVRREVAAENEEVHSR